MPRVTDDPWDELRREIDRSRRGDHKATLLRVESGTVGSGWRARRALTGAAARLEETLRSIDTVWVHRDALYVLLPETDQDAAEALVSRLWRDVPDLLPFDGLRMACFPAHGVTPNALRAAVERQPEGRTERVRGTSAPALEPAHESEQM
ncbi:hypothetical protein FSW04_17230 [Baekduia soli]|uniref:GGDEF domain-containing protein n=1 Tax=Baekduia soli TaxID=496014 RepID=A0A5B8U867_9ACTN|nr:hypothetical protein [Baekduia soli]QEC49147.1 hypothetical protein FSW04_17230 [Baekduia soli]